MKELEQILLGTVQFTHDHGNMIKIEPTLAIQALMQWRDREVAAELETVCERDIKGNLIVAQCISPTGVIQLPDLIDSLKEAAAEVDKKVAQLKHKEQGDWKCPVCGVFMARRAHKTHLKTYHGWVYTLESPNEPVPPVQSKPKDKEE